MAISEFTPVDTIPNETLAIVRYGIHRKTKIAIVIFSGITIVAMIIIVVLMHLRKQSNTKTTTTTTIDSFKYEITMTTTIETKIYISNKLLNFTDPELSFGFLLNHSIYFDFSSICSLNGSITRVHFRLFNNWQGIHPLYIFILLSLSPENPKIIFRYPIIPEKNNTQWQIQNIPPGLIPIQSGYTAGIGMHDSSKINKIYAIKKGIGIGMVSINVTNTTIFINRKFLDNQTMIAFVYTVTKHDND